MADYDIGEAFRSIEHELIASMRKNLVRHRVEESELGYNWAQWQVVQLRELERYRVKNADKFGNDFNEINQELRSAIRDNYNTGATKQERRILQNIRRMQKGTGSNLPNYSGTAAITGEFFKVNDRKLDALVEATTHDMTRAEYAVLRHANDQYRKIIFNAQVYANTGAGTYEKALDMACRDFLNSGINCIQYSNGRMVPIDVYAEMALRTASKRAYLQGEGEMRKKWGIHKVILNKRTNACPKCAPFCGKVIVDDVWSGGTAQEAIEGGYLLMSDCIADGLYHPNCQDSHTTYFGDFIDSEEEQYPEEEGDEDEPQYTADELLQPVTDEERQLNEELYEAQQRQNHCERQVQRFERLSEFSFDEDNRQRYHARLGEWEQRLLAVESTVKELEKGVAIAAESGIIELTRKKGTTGQLGNPISNRRFNELTIEARLLGAKIIRDDPWFNARMENQDASAISYGDVLVFGKNATISDVIEETYHFKQNLHGLNADKPHELRIILNEIDAKKYLIDNSKKYKIPRAETELTKEQLKGYEKQLQNWYEGGS